MTATTWSDFGAPVAREPVLRRVELIGLNARLSGAVDLGSFGRLTDFVLALPGPLRRR